MARFRTIHRSDTTSKALIQVAKDLGAKYEHLGAAIDGLIYHRGVVYMVDFKTPGATLTDKQAKLVAAGWPIRFLSTPEQVQELLT